LRKKDVWILPGGKLEKKDWSYIGCLIRELGEELPEVTEVEIGGFFGSFDGITPHSVHQIKVEVYLGYVYNLTELGVEISESRMVSKEEIGKLNVSDITYKIIQSLIKDNRL